ncbi:MAG: Rieske (2Fe-2S) protein [Oceanospirillaceae bacterium]|nr:Rieske (2Fe-2S) protein [Oceanospirillaceae bacterium]
MTVLCHIGDIPESGSKGFEIEGRALFAVHHQGQFFVYENRCPHRGVQLEWLPDQFLDYERNFIQCATHGALFKIDDGQCIAGPCNGKHLAAVPFQRVGDELVLSA